MVNIVNPSDAVEAQRGSYRDQAVRNFDGSVSALWYGRATVPSSGTAASLDIVRYEPQLSVQGNSPFTVPAGALVTRLAFHLSGDVTLGAATGKLKLAPALAEDTAGHFVFSAAASGGVLAKNTAYGYNDTGYTPGGVTVGGADVVFKIYATGGQAAGSDVASTVTAATDTDIIVAVGFVYPDRLLMPTQVFKKPDQIASLY